MSGKSHYKKGDALSPREIDVVLGLTKGLSQKLIADSIGVSAHTVKFHTINLFTKLGARNAPHAVALWLTSKQCAACQRTAA